MQQHPRHESVQLKGFEVLATERHFSSGASGWSKIHEVIEKASASHQLVYRCAFRVLSRKLEVILANNPQTSLRTDRKTAFQGIARQLVFIMEAHNSAPDTINVHALVILDAVRFLQTLSQFHDFPKFMKELSETSPLQLQLHQHTLPETHLE